MATATDINEVRKNTDEPDETTYSDDYISGLIDTLGVSGASAEIWRKKAAVFASLVNTSEAGASHAFGDLYKNALAMADKWDSMGGTTPTGARTRVRKIERS